MNKFEDILTFRDGKQAWGNYLIEVSITQYVPYSTTSIVFYYSLSQVFIFYYFISKNNDVQSEAPQYHNSLRLYCQIQNQPTKPTNANAFAKAAIPFQDPNSFSIEGPIADAPLVHYGQKRIQAAGFSFILHVQEIHKIGSHSQTI